MVVAWASARVITHKTSLVTSPLRRVLGLCRPYFSDSDLKSRLLIAQGAALGLGRPTPQLANGHSQRSPGQRPREKPQPKIMDFLFRSSGAASQTLHFYG